MSNIDIYVTSEELTLIYISTLIYIDIYIREILRPEVRKRGGNTLFLRKFPEIIITNIREYFISSEISGIHFSNGIPYFRRNFRNYVARVK